MFNNNLSHYDVQIELAKWGNGNFGVVLLAKHLPTKRHVAIKKFCLEKNSYEDFKAICNELLVARQLNHPNLQTVINAFVQTSQIYIVTPFFCFGSCKDTIRNCFKSGFPEIIIAFILRDIFSAVSYMHQNGFIHGSIRASHILLNDRKAVLSAFRTTQSSIKHGKCLKLLHGLSALSKESINWLAPEVLEQNLCGFTSKSDIYSIGVTSCELANGIPPFCDTQPTIMYTEKLRGNMPTLLDQSTCPKVTKALETYLSQIGVTTKTEEIYSQKVFSEGFHQLTEICTNIQPSSRWPAVQLLSHSFFKQCKYTNLFDQLKRFGIYTTDYSNIKDEHLNILTSKCGSNTHFTWDFSD